MKLRLNELRRKIGELLYDTDSANPCCGEELAKIVAFPAGKNEMFLTLRIAKDCQFDSNGLVEVHDYQLLETVPSEEIWDILGAQLTCIHTQKLGVYQINLTAAQVERLREILEA